MYYIGDPEHQTHDWQDQGLPDNCAVAAQASIINQFNPDHPLTIDDADYIALANGWYHPGGGTATEDMGKLFDVFDIPHHQVDHASVAQLASELQQGHRVIVGVSSSELWDEGPLSEFWNWLIKELGLNRADFNPADHAVCVTGINVTDPSHPTVVLNDSGEPHGAGHEYPLDRFTEAWHGSDFHYVATDTVPLSASAPQFDVGAFLGIGTTLVCWDNGASLATAAEAGAVVSDIYRHVDWDQILASV